MKKAVSLVSISVMVIFAAAGCQPSVKKTATKPQMKDEVMVNVYYLAGKLGMSITSSSEEKLSFNDTINTVTIMLKQYQVYVNESYICPLGKTKKIDGQLWVRYSVADEIRSKLSKPLVEKPIEIPQSIKPLPPQEPKKAWELTGKTIVIDPGHGGKDPGAPSSDGYQEKTVNMEVAQQIAQILRDKGHRVIMTRNSDDFLELEERADIANRSKADVFVSIHSDSSAKSSTNGFTVYVERSSNWASNNLANAIDDRMAQTGISSNGVKKADFRVLTHTGCPAVLIELGYLSNYWEAKQLKNVDMQKKLAQAVVNGIMDYLKNR